MLQRIQTLILIISLIIELIMFFNPIAIFQVKVLNFYEAFFYGYSLNNKTEYSYSLIIFLLLIMTINIIIIFLYKKRIYQMRLCIYNTLLLIGLQLFVFYYVYSISNHLNADDTFIQLSAFLPFISAISHILAFKYIKKDEELVRLSEKLR
ncbi:MAG: DUF4293 domain-containing protein [Bacteroidales bacterium]|nr:DUF4293 domain-containing protein [Bacteroidales bacterium]